MPVTLPDTQPSPVAGAFKRLDGSLSIHAEYAPITAPRDEEVHQIDAESGLPLWQHFNEDGSIAGRSFNDVQPAGTEPFVRTESIQRPLYYQADGTPGFTVTDAPVLNRGAIAATAIFADQYGNDFRSNPFTHADMPPALVEQGVAWGEAIKAWVLSLNLTAKK